MSTQFIPFECLEQVFRNLLNNKSTLFNCSLVNRSWCRQVVPLLWSRPFNRLQWKPSSLLIQTYISCMTKEEKSFFTNLGIILPESKSSQPIFDYAKYLRKFNYQELSIYVNIWYRNHYQYQSDNCKSDDHVKINLITKELGKFLMSQSNLIHELYISKTFCFSQIMDITSFPGATTSLSHLQRIKITGVRDMEIIDLNNLANILIGLSKICTRIREIEVYKFYEASSGLIEGLTSLIKVQQNLSKFVVFCWNLNLIPLISALKTQIGSLREIGFTKTRFDNSIIFSFLASCTRLHTLSLQQCDGLFSENVGPIINSPPVGLKKLNLCDNDMSSDTLITLLHNTSNTLSQLTLDERTTITSTNIIETIATHCPNLSYLDIKVLNADIVTLLCPLRKTQLKHLVLNNVSSKGLYDDKKFPEIGTFLPKTLKNLGLIYWDFTLQSLQSFLENCDCLLEKLFLYRDNGLSDDHLDIITQYAKGKGTLKSLNFLFRSCGENSTPSQEAVRKAQEIIPMVQGSGRFV